MKLHIVLQSNREQNDFWSFSGAVLYLQECWLREPHAQAGINYNWPGDSPR